MVKPSWGKKLKCQSCGAVFYDMTVEKPACPKCATVFVPVVKGRRSATIPATAPKKPVVEVMGDKDSPASETLIDDDDDLDEALDDDNEDEGLIEDTSDLDDDDDDMAEIKEHVEVDLDN